VTESANQRTETASSNDVVKNPILSRNQFTLSSAAAFVVLLAIAFAMARGGIDTVYWGRVAGLGIGSIVGYHLGGIRPAIAGGFIGLIVVTFVLPALLSL